MVRFIFMLTHRDVTVPNALELLTEVRETGLRCIGFKDVGVGVDIMKRLVSEAHRSGMETFLEVVTDARDECVKSAETALELGVDYLIGGTYVDDTLKAIKGSEVKYFPYIGTVEGHPCVLKGSTDMIVADALRVAELGVDGVNLLAYRYVGDPEQLIRSVKEAINLPIIIAGSIDDEKKIMRVKGFEVWGFTIGGAIVEKRLLPSGSVRDQVTYVLSLIGER
ncbi:MAG: 4-hydroxythreonine-4-phosphate dehydrogenase [Candidatus Bathyarchaeia archaeon]